MQNLDGLPVIPDEIRFVFGEKVNHVPTPFNLKNVKDWLKIVDTQAADERDDLTVLLMETIWLTVDAWVQVGAYSDLRDTNFETFTLGLIDGYDTKSRPDLVDRLNKAIEKKA